jgi:hypothetical protein
MGSWMHSAGRWRRRKKPSLTQSTEAQSQEKKNRSLVLVRKFFKPELFLRKLLRRRRLPAALVSFLFS